MQRNRALVENVGSLALLQGANYLLPLITLPYLVRVLGTHNYGLLVFAQALSAYFVILTDYSFNLTATRQVAIMRDDPAELSRIFGTVIGVKLVLLASSFVLFSGAILAIPRFRADWPVYYAAFLMVVGNALYPVWMFQGLERMKHITVINISSKAAAAAGIFVFVRDDTDTANAALLQSAGFVAAAVLGLIFLRRCAPVALVIPSWRDLKVAVADGWQVFVSLASNSLFGNTNIFILGLFASNAVVGQFAVAEKIVRAVIGLSTPIGTAMFPLVSSLFHQSHSAAMRFLRRVALGGSILFFMISVGLYAGADLMAYLVTGAKNTGVGTLIQIMSLLPLTVFLDNIYGTQILLNVGMERQFMRALLSAGAFSLCSALLLVPRLGAVGSATVLALTGALVLVLMIIPVHRAGLRLHEEFV